jgi:hypothetical protein
MGMREGDVREKVGGSAAALALLVAAATGACLPPDDRPVPGSVLVTAEPSEMTKNGFVSADGWEVKLDRVMLTMGPVALSDEVEGSGKCVPYSDTHYERLFDFAAVEREKVGLVYGLGDCRVWWRLRAPTDASLLGSGVTTADARAMSDWPLTMLRVEGSLTSEVGVARFDLAFEPGFDISGCATPEGEALSALAIESETEHSLRIEVRAEELFRMSGNDAAPFFVGELALLGLTKNDVVTLDDLDSLLVSPEAFEKWPMEGVPAAEQPPAPENRLQLMYRHSLPRLTRIVGGTACQSVLGFYN